MVRLIYANYLIDQAKSFILWYFYNMFTYYTRYQSGQIESTLWHFYGLFDCKIPNRSERLFYPLTLYGFTICTQHRLGGNHRHRVYITKVLVNC